MSTLVLVPGFWLDASSWDEVSAPLRAAGHEVVPLTLPGLESLHADRSGIGLAEHVAAVVAEIDRHDDLVVLVGHSGGGTVIHGAVDQRPDRVARAVYVDSAPLPAGQPTNPHLPAERGEIGLPPWDVFSDDGSKDLDGLTPELLDAFRARAVPHPERAARDGLVLSDERRYDVPVTLISSTFTLAEIEQYRDAGESYFAELALLEYLTIVELPTGHWPQLSRPADLAAAIVAAL
ncbi:esterase [Aeromicrobium sp. Root495]|uniref:alpha/beta hydrolase n=1 Tax=Aeromicrobium sp. Root495 TaxID=1736550 RepID=UPI000701F3BB|nr:alpha/beta hydrolase [Aeromicrobium sp. Root495]KQY59055.1 esterase [Aeromicrobium sp. Root495]